MARFLHRPVRNTTPCDYFVSKLRHSWLHKFLTTARTIFLTTGLCLISAGSISTSAVAQVDNQVDQKEFTWRDVPAQVRNEPMHIELFGDSLVAGYGLQTRESLSYVLQNVLEKRGFKKVTIGNSGVSGDTSADGLARAQWVLTGTVDAVVVALGANDMLRGLPPINLYSNLAKIVTIATNRDIEVLIAGMKGGRNWGTKYEKAFENVYPALAKEKNVALYPFLLQGVALVPEYNQDDRLHPNATGIGIIALGILPEIEHLILRVAQKRTKQFFLDQEAAAKQRIEEERLAAVAEARARAEAKAKAEAEARAKERERIAKQLALQKAEKGAEDDAKDVLKKRIESAKPFDLINAPFKLSILP